jgi:phosphoglycolate phosphatase
VGGTAVGVATDEPECLAVDVKKRAWLAAAGADYIIPNYLEDGLAQLFL